MSASAISQDIERRLHPGRMAAIAVAMCIVFFGLDFFFNAGLLSRNYVRPGPVFLAPALMFRRISFGYGSLVLLAALLLWLEWRSNIRGARAGAGFGTVFGLAFGASLSLGFYSMFPLGEGLLVGWATCLWAEFTVAGALGGAGLAQCKLTRLYAAAAAILIGSFAVVVVMQSTGLAVATQR